MSKSKLEKFLYTLVLTTVTLAACIHFNLLGRVAFAIEQAALDVVDDQLPTQAEVDELARVNRLVAKKALAAVVAITTEEDRARFGRFRAITGQGSGVIIDADHGYILTNNHVIDGAGRILVQLRDGRQFEAEVIGTDQPTDIAILNIDADHLFQLSLGDSNSLQIGDPVMTVGNPFGYQGTVSKGIVSAIGRSTALRILDYEEFIQTDAVINPGNSGGPLVNMRAEIVGLSTAMETRTGSFNGVGFAIPSARIIRVLPALLRGEKVVRGYLGISMEDVKRSIERAQQMGWDQTYGVLIDKVLEDSPAEAAGLQGGDILAKLNDVPVEDTGFFTEQIAFTAPGDTIHLDIWRGQELVKIDAVVDEQPENFSTRGIAREPAEEEFVGVVPFLGLVVEELSRQHLRQYDLPRRLLPGVVVIDVERDSLAESSGLEAGDVIRSIAGRDISTLDELRDVLESLSEDSSFELRIRNAEGSRLVQISAPQ